MELGPQILADASLLLAVTAGRVANFCDHVEHNEPADITAVRRAGEELRLIAVELSDRADRDPVELYACRLASIEQRNVLWHTTALDGAQLVRTAETWRALQLVQSAHDRAYHADVVGLTKTDQLRHYALHVAKLAGATAGVARGEIDEADWLQRRVPDMLLFGIKLATVSGEKLSEEHLPHRNPSGEAQRDGTTADTVRAIVPLH